MGTATATDTSTRLSPSVRNAVELTEVYVSHASRHPAIREAACLEVQTPHMLTPLRETDTFAGGGARRRLLYVGTMWWATLPCGRCHGKQGGYCYDFDDTKYAETPGDAEAIERLREFWRTESTPARIDAGYTDEQRRYLLGAGPLDGGRGGGFVIAPNMDILLRKGIPGVAADVKRGLAEASRAGDTDRASFYRGLTTTIRLITDTCARYESEARAIIGRSGDANVVARMSRIADALSSIAVRGPRNLFEAIQLWWIYNVLASGRHIEGWRIDEVFGDFLAADLALGELDESSALGLVMALWRAWDEFGDRAVCRTIVGGRGRRNEPAADAFALLAMEATRRLRTVIPQLTLRFYDGQDPALLDKAYELIGEGCVFPNLYNDDVNIPGVMRALHVSEEEACAYYPLGCGEYLLGGATPSLLNFGWNVPRVLEVALFGGVDARGRQAGRVCPTAYETFDDLWGALLGQVEFSAKMAADTLMRNDGILAAECAFLFGSLLTEDCVARGRSMLDGGARYIGTCVMAHGFTNAADGLVAIKKKVFEEKAFTLDALRDALVNDFEGAEDLRRQLAACPKFGNDVDEVDDVLVELWREISRIGDRAGRDVGVDFFTVSSVNPGGYFLGGRTGATPDGRRAKQPFAIGHAPTAGNDTQGLTALLNSLSKVDAANGGATSNVKLAKELFTRNLPKLKALLDAYWRDGGMQASLTVVSQAELLDAVDHPEKYPHVLVRVGGWTARFVDLERRVQQDVIRRTMH